MPVDNALTPALMYRAAAVVAFLDVLLAIELGRKIGAEGLRLARWHVAAVSGLFWFAVWATMHTVFWQAVYSHVFPDWSRWLVPPVFGAGFAALALGWRRVALGTGRLAVATWVALWGATGALTHTWGIFGRGLLVRSPMLQRLTPASAIVFAIFEFGFYGCAILTVAWQVRRRMERRSAPTGHGPAL